MLRVSRSKKQGYALLLAIIAITIFSIFLLAARELWETEITRDLEDELIFRARQYVQAIQQFMKKNNNLYPQDLDTLYKKKFLRKRYKDPMSEEGQWNVVMQSSTPGKKELLIVPEELVSNYLSRARIIGVSSTSPLESFREYRKKKNYHEWAFYVGEKVESDMPELKFINF